ncbi:GNAT family N-acetyltransferase [Paenibacillus sp. 1001270B_150601_E10]|uniref:GNAT family N-acetyltransferase n=1 Tax=Paenibacillus sp. 1001270B_150601_E10 TaxID=2787079 RepID=UPI00189DEFF8|nr:GNAT family N-acetyltransferase [Paenibacillus sp. 1001270B_150601_E10]
MLFTSRSSLNVIDHPSFRDVEAQYNVLYAILKGEDALCVHTREGDLLLGQTPGYFAWLYLQSGLMPERNEKLINELVAYPYESRLPGVTGDSSLISGFVEQYAREHHLTPTIRMELQAYHCPLVSEPVGVRGHRRTAAEGDEEVIARFLVGLNDEAMNHKVQLEDVRPRVQAMIPTGNLHVWEVDGQVVSLAAATHRSPRHVRINMVFTDPNHRGKQYAGALVGGLSKAFIEKGCTPMLYADANYASSNKAYQRIGFVECGRLTEYRFDEQTG